MNPYYQDKWVQIFHGDCREILPSLSGFSAVVTDPPYELGFMGKSWDSQGVSFQKETWEIIRKACLSGSSLLSFGGTRTQHRIACAIEDAGWILKDTLMWVYGSGFPKSLDISKAIDKQQGTYVKGEPSPNSRDSGESPSGCYGIGVQTKTLPNPQSPEAQLWEGYGTALKPAYEPIILAMNPLDGTFANNALKHKVAGLNIDGCRIGTEEDRSRPPRTPNTIYGGGNGTNLTPSISAPKGRFPANFLHDGSQMVMELFPNSKDGVASAKSGRLGYHGGRPCSTPRMGYGSNGSAARFFYCAKASKAERDRGLEGLEKRQYSYDGRNKPIENPYQRNNSIAHNNHPTVKPLALMEYLVKLVKMPEYNLIIDPFCGSGTTLLACIKLGIPCIGIDLDEQACEITAKRCQHQV